MKFGDNGWDPSFHSGWQKSYSSNRERLICAAAWREYASWLRRTRAFLSFWAKRRISSIKTI